MANKCFICGEEKVIWNADNDLEDFDEEGEGIVSEYTCMNCGASYVIYQRFAKEDENADKSDTTRG